MNVGTLTIEIAAGVARLQADMNEAKRVVTSATKEMEAAVGFLKTAFIGLTGVAGVLGFKAMIDGAIEGKARLYDLSLQTGISVEALSSLGKVAKFSNTSLDSIAGASNKLSKALFTQNEDSMGAAAAIKALGLNFEQFKQLAPDEQMRTLAMSMDGFADGSAKSAAAMLLFGKAGAELLPFMRELAERHALVGKETTASALAAKEYEDSLVALRNTTDAWKRQLATELLPPLIAVTEELLRMKEGGDSIGGLFTGAIKTAFQTVAVLAANVAFVFKGVGNEIGAWFAQIAALGRGDFSGFTAISEAVKEDGVRARKELDEFEKRVLGIDDLKDQRKQETRGFTPQKPKLDDSLSAATAKKEVVKQIKQEADAYGPLLARVQEHLTLQQREYEGGQKLTEAQKFQIDVLGKVGEKIDKLTVAEVLVIAARLEEAVRVQNLNLALQAETKAREEARKEIEKSIAVEVKHLAQLDEMAKTAQEQLANFGKTTDELQTQATMRDRVAAATLRQRAAELEARDEEVGLVAMYREQAKALERLANDKDMLAAKDARARQDPYAGAARAVKAYMADVKNAGDATEQAVGRAIGGLEDSLTDFVRTGKLNITGLVDMMIAEFIRLQVVKPMLANIFGGGGGGGVGGLLGLFSGGGAASTGAELSGAAGMPVGTFAMGGDPPVGRPSIVGENGPELFMPKTAGTIVPRSAMGGSRVVNVNNYNTFGQGVSPSQLAQALDQNRRQTMGEISEQIRHGSRAFG